MVPLVALVFALQVVCSMGSRNYGHERVVSNLIDNYDEHQRMVRPESNTTVKVGLTLLNVQNFSDKTGVLKATYWLKLSWTDERLKWEDSSVASVRYPVDKLWVPDIRNYWTVSHNDLINKDIKAVVYNTGMVMWVPPMEITSQCYAPEDPESKEWTCKLRLGSWTYNSWDVAVTFFNDSKTVDLEPYRPALSGWDIAPEEGEIFTGDYDYPEPYRSLIFSFNITKIPGGVADRANGASLIMSSQVTTVMLAGLLLVLRLFF